MKRRFMIFPLILAAAVAIVGFIFTKVFQPQKSAGADHCVGALSAAPAFRNSCDFPVNLTYCFATAGNSDGICRTVLVRPGEGVSDAREHYRAAGEVTSIGQHACKAPYLPAKLQHVNDRHVFRYGCVTPPEEARGQ